MKIKIIKTLFPIVVVYIFGTMSSHAQEVRDFKKKEIIVNVFPKSTESSFPLAYYLRFIKNENTAYRVQLLPIVSSNVGSQPLIGTIGIRTSFGIEKGRTIQKVRVYHGLQADYGLTRLRARNSLIVNSTNQSNPSDNNTYVHELGLRGFLGVQYYVTKRIFAGMESSLSVTNNLAKTNDSTLVNSYTFQASPLYGVLVGYSF